MSVNAGDPVTAELMQNIITNINTVNSLATGTDSTTTATAGSTGGYGAPAAPSITVTDSGRIKVACKKDGTGGEGETIYFKKTFSKAPNIVCSIWNSSGSKLMTLKYMPVVTSFTATEFNFRMIPVGATAEGSLYMTWVASI